MAHTNKLNSIAFPCISTGVYGYPKDEACEIAVSTVADEINKLGIGETLEVNFVCYDRESYELYQNQFN
jgi:O-acetyl-ADP-ribose deacetylase (regulator of RNase III)